MVALVPGRFVSRLLQKKRGFSETEAYFNTQRKLFQERAPRLYKWFGIREMMYPPIAWNP